MDGALLFRDVEIFDGLRTRSGRFDVAVADGTFTAIGAAGMLDGDATSTGGALLPGIVDAHIHVSFSTPERIVAGGVISALSLGEPIEVAFASHAPLRLRSSGPLLTSPGGYPTQTWGAGGYGLEVTSEQHARDAVAMLAARGAAMIKIALHGEPSLNDACVAVITAAAGEHGLQTIAHALTVDAVVRAVGGAVSALAHAPVEPLPAELVEACGTRGMTVVSTVRAFGDARSTRTNLRALAEAGCRIVYGTDLGNDGITPGVDAKELAIVEQVLGSKDAALAAATSIAAGFAGFAPARITEGASADVVHAASLDYRDIARPHGVFIGGRRVA